MILIACLSLYYVLYIIITCLVYDSPPVHVFLASFYVINAIFAFVALMLYWFTIKMLRNAIE